MISNVIPIAEHFGELVKVAERDSAFFVPIKELILLKCDQLFTWYSGRCDVKPLKQLKLPLIVVCWLVG